MDRIDVNWFKKEFESYLKRYDVEYRFFEQGDLGDLSQVEFNSEGKGGEIDFWSSGWLNIHFVNYSTGDELINILLDPNQNEKKEYFMNQLKDLL